MQPCISSYCVLSWHGLGVAGQLSWPKNRPGHPSPHRPRRRRRTPVNPRPRSSCRLRWTLGPVGRHIRLRTHPAWQARYRPYVRVGQARTAPEPEEETAPPPQVEPMNSTRRLRARPSIACKPPPPALMHEPEPVLFSVRPGCEMALLCPAGEPVRTQGGHNDVVRARPGYPGYRTAPWQWRVRPRRLTPSHSLPLLR